MEEFDAIVVGGGPAGSTAATLVAKAGRRVLLLEKEAFPVHKIGESLLPSTINGVCVMLGVSEEIARAGFVRKSGGTFRWGRSQRPWTVRFSNSRRLPEGVAYAYQVERMKFDSILLENAAKSGVDVRQRHAVTNVVSDGERVTGVTFVDSEGRRREAAGRYVVDASGWTTRLGRHVGARIYSNAFRNVAVYGYFANGDRLPPPNSGNIFSVAFSHGWCWYIPLSETLTSVGVVIGQEYASILTRGLERAYRELLDECQPVRQLLERATRVTSGPYGEVRVRKDYSYCQTTFWRPGLALVGDAACFIDPVFSSGVHLATYSGVLVARSINSCLAGAIDEERSFAEFQRRYQREYQAFYDFLVAFYNVEQDVQSYYWAARQVLKSDEREEEAFIELIAGIGGSGEQLFDSVEAYQRHQASLSERVFPMALAEAGEPIQHRPDEAVEGMKFVSNLLRESIQLEQQAVAGVRGRQLPLFPGGLVVSPDGSCWAEPMLARGPRAATPVHSF